RRSRALSRPTKRRRENATSAQSISAGNPPLRALTAQVIPEPTGRAVSTPPSTPASNPASEPASGTHAGPTHGPQVRLVASHSGALVEQPSSTPPAPAVSSQSSQAPATQTGRSARQPRSMPSLVVSS